MSWLHHLPATPVVLDTQEAEIRVIMVQSQPRQIVIKALSGKKNKPSQKGVGGIAQGVGPKFKPLCHKKKKKERKEIKMRPFKPSVSVFYGCYNKLPPDQWL
jgi:hypothetical protein